MQLEQLPTSTGHCRRTKSQFELLNDGLQGFDAEISTFEMVREAGQLWRLQIALDTSTTQAEELLTRVSVEESVE